LSPFQAVASFDSPNHAANRRDEFCVLSSSERTSNNAAVFNALLRAYHSAIQLFFREITSGITAE
jgi:hypothetical protein